MKNSLVKVICLIFIFIICSDQWAEKYLDQNYLFKWKTDDIRKGITIRLEVKTKGWISFGFSAHGKFKKADMVYGWVTDQGQSFFNDFWIDENQTLSLDKSQDWYLKSGTENGTHTIFEFSRKYVTCDSLNDLEIYENEFEFSNMMWAYSLSDPQSVKTIFEPQLQGHLQFNLFRTHFEPKESDLQMFDNWVNLTLPSTATDTSYEKEFHCKIFKVNWTENSQIVKYQNVFSPSPIHIHNVLRRCPSTIDKAFYEKHLGVVFPCLDFTNLLSRVWEECTSKFLFTSEFDMVSVSFPSNVGIALNPRDVTYFVMSVQIKPRHNTFNYSLSTRMWTTKQIRKYESDMLYFGNSGGIGSVEKGMLFPPLNHGFLHASIIDYYCLQQGQFDDKGIFIFALTIHSHYARKMEVRHYRNRNLIKNLEYNNYYGENHPMTVLKEPINFRTTDKMAVICHYDPMNEEEYKSKGKLKSEGCFIVSYYYPKSASMSNFIYYRSGISYTTMLNVTGLEEIENYTAGAHPGHIIIRKPSKYNNTKLLDFLDQFKYKVTDTKLLEDILISGKTKECCINKDHIFCKLVKSPPQLYRAIVNEKKQNSCTDIVTPRPDQGNISKSAFQESNSTNKLMFSLKVLLKHFKLSILLSLQ